MTTSTDKTQNRGICQCCARDQAVLKSGKMSKHGYTVEGGWFSGVCHGQNHKPLNVERTVCDSTIRLVRASAASLREKAAALLAGEIDPVVTERRLVGSKWTEVEVAYASVSVWKQEEARKHAVWSTNRRAEIGEAFANDLEATADRVHGTPLRVVVLEAGPAPIRSGETRVNPENDAQYVCSYVDGARVYWKCVRNEKTYSGWTGTQAWRRMALVETAKAA